MVSLYVNLLKWILTIQIETEIKWLHHLTRMFSICLSVCLFLFCYSIASCSTWNLFAHTLSPISLSEKYYDTIVENRACIFVRLLHFVSVMIFEPITDLFLQNCYLFSQILSAVKNIKYTHPCDNLNPRSATDWVYEADDIPMCNFFEMTIIACLIQLWQCPNFKIATIEKWVSCPAFTKTVAKIQAQNSLFWIFVFCQYVELTFSVFVFLKSSTLSICL